MSSLNSTLHVDFDYEDEDSEDTDSESAEDAIPTAELEIEGDFDRLVKNIRNATGSSVLSRDWDFRVQESDAEFREALKAASGVGRPARKKIGRARNPVLSSQVRALIGEGNQAYVDCDITEAMRIMQEVIRIEPRASSAWSVLAKCYDDRNEPEKALQLRIMAAHLRHDAEEWDCLARYSRSLGYLQQALYCIGKLCSLDPTNIDSQWDRASLAKETGELRIARNALLSILKRYPHDLTVMSELRPILVDLSDFALCASLFQGAFDHYQSLYPSGPPGNSSSSQPLSTGVVNSQLQCFGLLDLLVLTDLYNSPTLAAHDRAITVIRRGCRWLQGRGTQKVWDTYEDDREYDLPGNARNGRERPGNFELDVNARQRLAVARIKMGDIQEGKMHANIVLAYDATEFAPLFVEIADAYFDQDLYADANPVYEILGADAGTSSLYILMRTAACYRALGQLREAAEVYEHVKLSDPHNNDAKMQLAEIYEILNEPRKALELVYEVIDSRKKRHAFREGIDADQSGSLFEERGRGTDKSKKTKASLKFHNRLSLAQLRELEESKEKEVLKGYKRVKDLWSQTFANTAGTPDGNVEMEREWLFEAEKLVETFRETRNLFLTSRNTPFRGMFPRKRRLRQEKNQIEEDEDRMASRLQLNLEHDTIVRQARGSTARISKVDVFRGVSFSDWLRVFIQYAFVLTQNNQYDLADEILRHLLLSNAYQSRESQDKIRLSLLTCAISINRYQVIVEQVRKLIGVHQFNNEPLRILLVSLASGVRPTDSFITSTLQKHIFREIRLGDAIMKNPDSFKWNQLTKRWVPTSTNGKGGDGETIYDDVGGDDAIEEPMEGASVQTQEELQYTRQKMPTKYNPVPVALHGQVCIAAKSYQSAIFYLLHAYDYCPNDPVICLSLAIANIGRASQRQSDNRHHFIAQAMAFLSRYRQIRGSDAEGLGEVDYNFGRAFQQLGLYALAVKHYERVLEMSEANSADHPGLAKEAAYNLSLIFVTTGATPLAEALYHRWLSI